MAFRCKEAFIIISTYTIAPDKEAFIIIFPSSQYDLNNVERDVKHQMESVYLSSGKVDMLGMVSPRAG